MRVLVLGHTSMDRSRKRAETSRTDSKAFFRQWTGKPAGLWRAWKGGGECGPKPRPCSGPGIALGARRSTAARRLCVVFLSSTVGFLRQLERSLLLPLVTGLTQQAELPLFIGLDLIKMGNKI